jgi:hypothetical protein
MEPPVMNLKKGAVMAGRKLLSQQTLVFKTTKIGNKTYCGVEGGSKSSIHRPAEERNATGHDPGYVYVAYLPSGKYSGLYHIGKAEYTKVGTDDFDLDEIQMNLLEALKVRLKRYRRGTRTDEKYNGAKFVHGIRVACGEGAEKQPQFFFTGLGKLVQKGFEIFNLSEDDIETFKKAIGSVLGHPIKHLTAEEFAGYLATDPKLSDKINEWVVLPDIKVSTNNSAEKYPFSDNSQTSLSSIEGIQNRRINAAKPLRNARPVDTEDGDRLPLMSENNLVALKHQNHKAVHIVFLDAKSGKLRICRPTMLDTTYGSQPTEWEVVGRVVDAKHYLKGVAILGRKYCRECLNHLPIQVKNDFKNVVI